MIKSLVPKRIKNWIRSRLLKHLNQRITQEVKQEVQLQQALARPYPEGCYLHEPQASSWMIPQSQKKSSPGDPLPIPPRELWVGYGTTEEQYLQWGKEHVQSMRSILKNAAFDLSETRRILEWGCAAGRMMRWLADLAEKREIWGADILATHILWCQQHLTPPFHFTTTTVHPHLPFEDRYFDFIFAGSVFTHIPDLADTWFLELRRILQPGGMLYVTISDQRTIDHLLNGYRSSLLGELLSEDPDFHRFRKENFGMFTLGRSVGSHVFYQAEWLTERLAPFYRVVSVTEDAYAYQTALLLQRRTE